MLLSSYLQISVGWPFLSCYHEVSLLQGTPRLLTWPGIMAQCHLGRPHPHAETAVKLWLLDPHPARCSVPGKAAVTALDWGPCQPWRRGRWSCRLLALACPSPKPHLVELFSCVYLISLMKNVFVRFWTSRRPGLEGWVAKKAVFWSLMWYQVVSKDRLALNMLS